MKLKRYDIWLVSDDIEREYCDDGDKVDWTPELQEAWDKQQAMEVINPFGYESSSTLNPIPSGYCNDCGQMLHKGEHYYCPNCGQKIKW